MTDTSPPTERSAVGRRASVVGVLVNLALFAGKFVAGLWSGSVSLRGDAFNNLSDAAASVVALVSFRLARKPADDRHPFGHARTEYIGTSLVALLIMVLAYELGRQSVRQLLDPGTVAYTAGMLWVLGVSILTKIALFLYYRHQGRAIGSELLTATARDALGDALASAAVLGAALVSLRFSVRTDGFLGLLVAAFIAWQGLTILRSMIDRMLGQRPDPAVTDAIKDLLLREHCVLGIHDLVVHDYGPGRQFATVHVEVDANEHVIDSHTAVDRLERDVRQALGIDLLIHMDPTVVDDPELNERRTEVSMLVASVDSTLSVHDFRIVDEDDGPHVIFDVTVPGDCPLNDDTLRERITRLIRRRAPEVRVTVTLDRAFTSN